MVNCFIIVSLKSKQKSILGNCEAAVSHYVQRVANQEQKREPDSIKKKMLPG